MVNTPTVSGGWYCRVSWWPNAITNQYHEPSWIMATMNPPETNECEESLSYMGICKQVCIFVSYVGDKLICFSSPHHLYIFLVGHKLNCYCWWMVRSCWIMLDGSCWITSDPVASCSKRRSTVTTCNHHQPPLQLRPGVRLWTHVWTKTRRDTGGNSLSPARFGFPGLSFGEHRVPRVPRWSEPWRCGATRYELVDPRDELLRNNSDVTGRGPCWCSASFSALVHYEWWVALHSWFC